MEQLELFSAPDPCMGICENSPRGYCKGCMRSRDERFNWHQKSVAEQLHIMQLCRRRYQRRLQRKAAQHQPSPTPNPNPNPPATQSDLF